MMKRFFEAANFSAPTLSFEAANFSASALLRDIRAHTDFVTYAAACNFKLLAPEETAGKIPAIFFSPQSLLSRASGLTGDGLAERRLRRGQPSDRNAVG